MFHYVELFDNIYDSKEITCFLKHLVYCINSPKQNEIQLREIKTYKKVCQKIPAAYRNESDERLSRDARSVNIKVCIYPYLFSFVPDTRHSNAPCIIAIGTRASSAANIVCGIVGTSLGASAHICPRVGTSVKRGKATQ